MSIFLLALCDFLKVDVGHIFFVFGKGVSEALVGALLQVVKFIPRASGSVAVSVPVAELVETLIGSLEGEGFLSDSGARNADLQHFEDRLIGAWQDIAKFDSFDPSVLPSNSPDLNLMRILTNQWANLTLP